MSYELSEATRLANRAIAGSPWTGGLDKHEVGQAVRRLIAVAESLDRECTSLRQQIGKKTRSR